MTTRVVSGPRKKLEELYKDVSGFVMDAIDPNGRKIGHARSLVYGELTWPGVERLAAALELGEKDVFYDLGSGVGKAVLQIAMTIPVKKSIGIELTKPRYEGSAQALKQIKKLDLIVAKQCIFRNESLMDSNLTDATAIYTASTCFSDSFMLRMTRKIASYNRPMRFVTLRDLGQRPRQFKFVRSVKLRATWTRTLDAYLYNVVPLE
jgi:hypothetical protein